MNVLNYAKPAQPKNLTHVLDDIFNTGFSNLSGSKSSKAKPAVNILENKDDYAIEIAAPGLKKDNFSISVDKDQLIVEATVNQESESSDDSGKYTRREFHFGSFKRSFHISDKINSDKIDAKYEDGILTLTLDKREEAKEKPARNIAIS